MIVYAYFYLIWTTCSSGVSTTKHYNFVLSCPGWTFPSWNSSIQFLSPYKLFLVFFTFTVTCHVELQSLMKCFVEKKKSRTNPLVLFWTHFPHMLFDILYFLGNEQQFLTHLFPWYQDFTEPYRTFIHFSFLNWKILI